MENYDSSIMPSSKINSKELEAHICVRGEPKFSFKRLNLCWLWSRQDPVSGGRFVPT